MRKVILTALIVMVVLAGCSGVGPSSQDGNGNGNGIDAGNGNGVTSGNGNGNGMSAGDGNGAPMDEDAAQEDTLGYSVGGASDINNFRDNIEEDYLPIPADVTPEGVFKEYYFDTGAQEPCEELFCPSYSQAVSEDPISGEREEFMTVGLNSGIEQSDFERPDLNLVVVVDTSGSMDSPFDQYYYDDDGNQVETEQRQKLATARDSVESMIDQLRGEDRVGIVSFNDNANTVVPLERVDERDMSGVRNDVQRMRANGGTNLDAGMRQAKEMVDEYAGESDRETRIVYVTDAMPNREGTSTEVLGGQLSDHADRGIYSTFVGVGVDFNAELVDAITGTRGANYYSVQSAAQFEDRMDDGFQYMVTPLVFDLSLDLDASGYEIEQVHGTPSEAAEDGDIFHVETLFPSQSEDGRTKGGVILVEVARTDAGADSNIELTASYENRAGERFENTEQVEFADREAEYFENDGIRKAVALARYAELSGNWLAYEWADIAGEEPDAPDGGIERRERVGLNQWERQSEDLRVSVPYDERFATFAEYFEAEIDAIGDEELNEELHVIYTLVDAAEGDAAAQSRDVDGELDAVGPPVALAG